MTKFKRPRRMPQMNPAELSKRTMNYVKNYGAFAAGINTVDTLAGGPPSTDLNYVLPGAKSAVTFAVAVDHDKVDDYLAKRDKHSHQLDYNRVNGLATGISAQLAQFVSNFGFECVGVHANNIYREDETLDAREMMPDISHKFLAARCGLGWFGFSGNILTPEHGPDVVFATMVTTAELVPTDPLPEEDNYCDDCLACNSSCPSGFFRYGKKDKVTITMGGIPFTYTTRMDYDRCSYVCGGYSGLHPSGKWSTWAPGRFPIPKNDSDIPGVMKQAFFAWRDRPYDPEEVPVSNPLTLAHSTKELGLSCGNCSHVCAPDPEVRKQRLKTLQESGVVIQAEDGTIKAVTPAEAEEYMDGLTPELRAFYEPPNLDALADIPMMGGNKAKRAREASVRRAEQSPN